MVATPGVGGNLTRGRSGPPWWICPLRRGGRRGVDPRRPAGPHPRAGESRPTGPGMSLRSTAGSGREPGGARSPSWWTATGPPSPSSTTAVMALGEGKPERSRSRRSPPPRSPPPTSSGGRTSSSWGHSMGGTAMQRVLADAPTGWAARSASVRCPRPGSRSRPCALCRSPASAVPKSWTSSTCQTRFLAKASSSTTSRQRA